MSDKDMAYKDSRLSTGWSCWNAEKNLHKKESFWEATAKLKAKQQRRISVVLCRIFWHIAPGRIDRFT